MNHSDPLRLGAMVFPNEVMSEPLDDPRLTAALEEYQAALDGGQRPDRHEFVSRYADLGEGLAEFLDGLDLVNAAVAQLEERARLCISPQGSGEIHRGAESQPLGDYRLLREVGRGGMGVVYEAVQLSLGRRVALKVLPFAAALDAKQLQRFKNEAQAAAHLHHSHIVPVFAVGCERGVHYYAMQFIDGQTLAAAIDDLRQRAGKEDRAAKIEDSESKSEIRRTTLDARGPKEQTRPGDRSCILDLRSSFFGNVADLGVQAAEALEYAHQLGVVHRDIKPANLLMDVRGNLWITDFGLARYQSDAGLTGSGDQLGTLRYMSPEQALAKRGVVDHRTDIYSLGATLYELLTLEPACPGQTRQEVLWQIASAEVKPPRRLQKAIPVELETIVLKALAKAPEERYATAQELADDLRRFLEDKPIQARPPTLLQRLKKWARRHKTWMRAAAVVAVLAVLFLAAGTVMVVRQRDEAEARRRQARRVVDEMYTQVAEKWLAQQPHLEPVQRDFLLKALQFYQEFASQTGTDPALRCETGKAYRRVGDIQHKLGQRHKAEDAYGRAVEVLEPLVRDFPAVPAHREELGIVLNHRGNWLREAGRLDEAEESYRKAQGLFQELVESDSNTPPYRDELAGSVNNLGIVLNMLNRPKEAEEAYRHALALFDKLNMDCPEVAAYRHDLAGSRHNLANLLASTGRLNEAEKVHRQALSLWEKLAADFPNVPAYRQALATSYCSLGVLWAATGRFQEAEQTYHQALKLQEKLAADFPRVPSYRQGLAGSQYYLANLLALMGRLGQAEQWHRQAMNLREKLAAEFPTVPAYTQDLAASHSGLGRLLQHGARLREAEEHYRQALSLRQRLVGQTPEGRHDVADSYHSLGSILSQTGRLPEAEKAYREALRLAQQLATDGGEIAHYRLELAACQNDLGVLLQQIGQTAEAEKAHRTALALMDQLANDCPEVPHYRFELALCENHLSGLLEDTGRAGEAEKMCRRAIALAEKLTADFPRVPDYQQLLAAGHANLGDLRAGRHALQGAGTSTEEAERALSRAVMLQAKLVADFPLVPDYRRDLAQGLARLGTLLARTGRGPQADKALRQALALQQKLAADFPAVPAYARELAWFLATCPDERLQDSSRAVQLAQKVAAETPEDGAAWCTLGVASYRAGDWPAAVAALKKSVRLRGGGNSLFFLAMSCRKLGDDREARRWYQQAVDWMEQNKPRDQELCRLRAEAELQGLAIRD